MVDKLEVATSTDDHVMLRPLLPPEGMIRVCRSHKNMRAAAPFPTISTCKMKNAHDAVVLGCLRL